MTTDVGLQGFAPALNVGEGNPEALKYGRLWKTQEYRVLAPGEHIAKLALSIMKPLVDSHIIDFGCGTGRGALELSSQGGLRVTMLDFVNNCLDSYIILRMTQEPEHLRFVKADLEKPIPLAAEYGYCTDVMEHIPPEKVNLVLRNILHAAQYVFFSICTVDDEFGPAILGEPLHLSKFPYSWWMARFSEIGCNIHWSLEEPQRCHFYVSAWMTGQAIVDAGVLNTQEEQIRANVKYNTAQGWTQVQPHVTNEFEVMLVGGGPSLCGFVEDIKKKREDGVKLITLNGSYNWALALGMTPSAQIIVDARAFNARFTKPIVDGCKYLISSQCDPSVFEGLPWDRTFIWHTTTELIKDILTTQYPQWWAVPGGSTVLLRAIPLMRMLGYKRFHLYGCDSCIDESTHHAYMQPENDSEHVINVLVTGGRIFKCHPWMVAQAQEMMDLIKFLGDEIELEIHGDGLLSHILETGASFAPEGGE